MNKVYYLFFALLFLASSASTQILWENFEDTRKGTYGFINGTFIPYTENPDKMGNTSLVAASYTRNAGETFDVLILDAAMADMADYISGTKTMSMDIWSPAVGKTIQITLENDQLAQPANFPTGRHSVYLATTTVANGWETITFAFDSQPDATVANDNVNRVVFLFDPNTNNGDTYYWDNFNGPELANDPCADATPDPTILNDFECNQNVDFVFSHSGINFRRVSNPDQMGNASPYAATYTRNGAETFDVIIGFFDGNLALNSNSTISLDVWDPNAPTEVIVSLQNAANDVILEMTAMTSTSNAWQTLDYDPSSVAAATDIAKFVILFDPDTNTSDRYYFDNFVQGTSTAVEDLVEVTDFQVAPNPSQGMTNFQYDLQNSGEVNLSIYDLTGKAVEVLVRENQNTGTHQATWDATTAPNGIYLYTLSVNGKVASGKISVNR